MAKSTVQFIDNTLKVIDKTNNAIEAELLGCVADLVTQTAQNTRVDTGKTKGSWQGVVEKKGDTFEAVVGSTEENAIWEEFGTGEYALEGNGRKGGWTYVDEEGKGHFTHGKKPSRAFWNAYTSLKPSILNRLERFMK